MRFSSFFIIPLLALVGIALAATTTTKVATTTTTTAVAAPTGGGNSLIEEILGALGEVPGLIAGLTSVIGPLLNFIKPETFENLDVILKNTAWLLDDAGVNRTKNLITNANNLLTPTFVKEVGALINAVAPLLDTISSVLGGIINLFFGGN